MGGIFKTFGNTWSITKTSMSVLRKDKELLLFPFFAGIDKEGFRRPVVVGDALYLEVSVLQQRSESCKLQGTATVGDEIAAQSQILAVLRSSH